jgi:hypothetical protein
MSTTKRDLLELIKDYPDDILIEVGLPNSEPGAQHSIIEVVYATGAGRSHSGQRSLIILMDDKQVEEEEEKEKEENEKADPELDELVCPFCEKVIEKCMHCGEEL